MRNAHQIFWRGFFGFEFFGGLCEALPYRGSSLTDMTHDWVYHSQPQPLLLRGRRRSLSDLDAQRCDCPANQPLVDDSIAVVIESLLQARFDRSGMDDMDDLRRRLTLANLRQRQSTAQEASFPDRPGDDSYYPQKEEEHDDNDDNQYDGDEWCM